MEKEKKKKMLEERKRLIVVVRAISMFSMLLREPCRRRGEAKEGEERR